MKKAWKQGQQELHQLAKTIYQEGLCSDLTANQLIRLASDLTYRQLVILRVIGAYQTGDLVGVPPRRNSNYGHISGYDNISIASEIFDLYRKSLVFSRTAILDAAGIIPSKLEINGVGALLYNLMDLPYMPYDKLSERIILFLTLKN